MANSSKKYLQKREDDHPSLGNFVHWFIKQQNVLKKNVAQDLEIGHITLSQYFRKHSLQFSTLWRISKSINYNMVMDLGERLDIPYETKEEKKLKAELAQTKKAMKEMEIEIRVLKEMMNGR